MDEKSKLRLFFNSCLTWEAPWNHMTYFWKNEGDQLGEDSDPEAEMDCPERHRECRVVETEMPEESYSILEDRCMRDIEAIKPVPWRNVFPKSKHKCTRRGVCKGADVNDVKIRDPQKRARTSSGDVSRAPSRKCLKMVPRRPVESNEPRTRQFTRNSCSDRTIFGFSKTCKSIYPPIIPLWDWFCDIIPKKVECSGLNLNCQKSCIKKQSELAKSSEKKKCPKHVTFDDRQVLNDCTLCAKCGGEVKEEKKPLSSWCESSEQGVSPRRQNESQKGGVRCQGSDSTDWTRWQPAQCSVCEWRFGVRRKRLLMNKTRKQRRAILKHRRWLKRLRRASKRKRRKRDRLIEKMAKRKAVCFECRNSNKKGRCTEECQDSMEMRKYFRIKRTPKLIRTSPEYLNHWRVNEQEQSRAEVFQRIRDAAKEKPRFQICDDDILNLAPHVCHFCNQPLSPFGLCVECLPPTPVAKAVRMSETVNRHVDSLGEIVDENSNTTIFDPYTLFHEMNAMQTKLFSAQNPSGFRGPTKETNEVTFVAQPQPFLNLFENERSRLPVASNQPSTSTDLNNLGRMSTPIEQKLASHSRNVVQLPYPREIQEVFADALQSNVNSSNATNSSPTSGTVFEAFAQNNSNIYNTQQANPFPIQASWPTNNNTPFNTIDQNTLPVFPNPQFVHPVTTPTNVNFQINATSQQEANGNPPTLSTGSFVVTMDVGNASPQDITVVLYSNRILVAEAANRLGDSETVLSQTWGLPPNVDVQCLRCYLDQSKLYVVAYPLPPNLEWKFGSVPAALGPPRYSSTPCPFEP